MTATDLHTELIERMEQVGSELEAIRAGWEELMESGEAERMTTGAVVAMLDRCCQNFGRIPRPCRVDEDPIPEVVLRVARPSERVVYAILCDLGAAPCADIQEEYQRRVDAYAGRTTVSHALTRLCRVGLIEHRGPNCWALKGES